MTDDYGYVYCMINNSMPNLCKIGCVIKSKRTSHTRANELYTTGVPEEFIIVLGVDVNVPVLDAKSKLNPIALPDEIS